MKKKRDADFQKTNDALLAESSERQRAEEALRASEQRLQDILDNTTAVVFVKDLELRYILVNREYERRHQVQRGQVRGKPTLIFIQRRSRKSFERTTGMSSRRARPSNSRKPSRWRKGSGSTWW